MIYVILLILALLLILARRKYPKGMPAVQDKRRNGEEGEERICGILDSLPGYHRILRNVYVPTGDHGTTEIDVIFICRAGIYVIESKDYSGQVFGKATDHDWTQVTYYNGQKHTRRFYSPILQNEGHVRALRAYLGRTASGTAIHSLIVFGPRTDLRYLAAKPYATIIRSTELYSAVTTGGDLDNDRIDRLYKSLYPLTQVTERQKQEHIRRARAAQGR